MGTCCSKSSDPNNLNIPIITLPAKKVETISKEYIDPNKYFLNLKLNPTKEINIKNPNIKLLIIHVETTTSTMPSSREVIDKGETLPFIFNTKIQTAGRGKGSRKWAGSIEGNVYTTTCIPIKNIPDELNDNNIIIQITSVSIIQYFDQLSQGEFLLKYPNDILCKDRHKLGGIIAETYKNYMLIGFGLNIVDKPEADKIRKEGLQPCFLKEHLNSGQEVPSAIDVSIEVTNNILYNLNLKGNQISKIYDEFTKEKKSTLSSKNEF